MAAENVGAVKIVGYLEKKGKLKVVTTWKKYWFVLEGRLLLYYRSQEEYENLSPCKGSINMGLATNIQPGLAAAGVFQIITRTNTVTLRAKDRSIQEKWLQALLDASGQQTASNPIRMSHFRYSMDDLIPAAGAKQQHQQPQQARQQHPPTLTRQNTLPHRFKTSKLDRHHSIIERIRQIGGHSYGGSLDTIDQISKAKARLKKGQEQEEQDKESTRRMSEKSLNETESDLEPEVILKNDLYSGIVIDNTEYISSEESNKNDLDHNKNCYIIENDQYIKSDAISLKNDESSTTQSENSRPDDVEYYCTYEEVNAFKQNQNIYNEPDLPPRPDERRSESEDCSSCGKEETKKVSKFARFARRLKSMKQDDNGFKKRSASLIMKVMGKKKSNDQVITEPIYDTVNYFEINKTEPEKEKERPVPNDFVKTLMDLQQTLEAKKSQIKEILESGSSSPTVPNGDAVVVEEVKQDCEETSSTITSQPEDTNPPWLPPRRVSRPRSPFHDVPKNNSPVKQHFTNNLDNTDNNQLTNYSIDKILDDLEMERRKSEAKQAEELSVRQLIDRFNQNSLGSDEINAHNAMCNENTADVFLRQKCEGDIVGSGKYPGVNIELLNRHSDDLNKLLEELTKVTSAPLLEPGATSSLVQMKSPPMTDEEWLEIAPIRRRRHSEPDYDVPRPHRSLQIIPRSPDKDDNDDDSIIPATRFFGPVLPPSLTNDKSYSEATMSWRSMTPDSLEPLQILQAAMRQQRKSVTTNSDVEQDRSVGYERTSVAGLDLSNSNEVHEVKDVSNNLSNGFIGVPVGLVKSVDTSYLDSLEPYNEGATAF